MTDGVHHPAQLRGIGTLDRLVDAAQAQRLQRASLLRVGAVGGLDLGDQETAHAGVSSVAGASASASAAAGASASASASAGASSCSTTFAPLERPSTALPDRPRS